MILGWGDVIRRKYQIWDWGCSGQDIGEKGLELPVHSLVHREELNMQCNNDGVCVMTQD